MDNRMNRTELLTSHIEGRLDLESRRLVEQLITEDDTWASEYEQLKETLSLLSEDRHSWRADPQSESYWNNFLPRVRELIEERRRRRKKMMRGIPVLAAFAAVFFILILTNRADDPEYKKNLWLDELDDPLTLLAAELNTDSLLQSTLAQLDELVASGSEFETDVWSDEELDVSDLAEADETSLARLALDVGFDEEEASWPDVVGSLDSDEIDELAKKLEEIL